MTRALLALTLGIAMAMVGQADAALIDNGDGTVTDDDLGIMWLQSPGPDADFGDAEAWADSLVFAGYDDWRLPSALAFGSGLPDEGIFTFSTNNEFGHLYGLELGNPADAGDIVPLVGYNPIWFWTGTPDPDSAADAFVFFWSFDGLWGIQSTADGVGVQPDSLDDVLHVTAVRAIQQTPAPEPATLLILGFGLTGAALLRTRRSA